MSLWIVLHYIRSNNRDEIAQGNEHAWSTWEFQLFWHVFYILLNEHHYSSLAELFLCQVSVIAVCILIVIFGIVGTFLNTLVLFVFSKSKKMRQKNSYFFIMILSATDLAAVTTVPAVFLFKAIPECLGTPRCLYSICVNIGSKTTPLLTATSLIIMNIARYLVIVHSFSTALPSLRDGILVTPLILMNATLNCLIFF